MEVSLNEIATWVNGKIVGDPHLRIREIASIEEAKSGEITFIANPKYVSKIGATQASAILLKEKIACTPVFRGGGIQAALLLVEDPYFAFAQILSRFHPPRRYPTGVDPRAAIGSGVILGEEISIGPFVTVEEGAKIGAHVRLGAGVFVGEGSEIGAESLIYPNVTIREGVKIGKRVILHSGTVIGGDGFGFAPRQGRYHKVPQVGGVIIEDDVELGANVTVDRGVLGNTIIGRGTKVDNLVQVAHNVVIGGDCILVSQVGISGSSKIGDHVTLAGQVGVAGHLTIGDGVVIGGKSGVTKDIAPHENVSGFPAIPHKNWLKAQVSFPHLPEIRKKMKELERQIERLEHRMEAFAPKGRGAGRKEEKG